MDNENPTAADILAEDPNTAAVVQVGEDTQTDTVLADHGVEAAEDALDPNDPAVTGIPRDERQDSIDPHTGTLSAEAQELRREQAAEPVAEGE